MKKWIIISLSFLAVSLSIIGGFNFFMDPFWCFEQNHAFNSVQKGTNERQQKVNKIYFGNESYDTLLLGSSRTTYMNRHAFKGMNVYNLSASGMLPQEYLHYIDFVVSDAHQPIRTIIIGMDFFGYLNRGSFMFKNASSIVQTVQSPYYRWKILFSFDALNTSFKNLRDYLNPTKHSGHYNRDNVKTLFTLPVNKQRDDQILVDLTIYGRSEYASQANPNYKELLKAIKNRYPNKQFLIYTTPISKPLFKLMVEKGHYQNYETWLRALVNEYGQIYHFMYMHSVSNNYLHYFYDSNHAYPETNALIAHKITMPSDPNIPKDFGMLITRTNIDQKLQELRVLNKIHP